MIVSLARHWWALLVVTIACSGGSPGRSVIPGGGERQNRITFDNYIEQIRGDWEVPGMAVAVVRGDRLVLAKGYGVRRLDRPDRVDADTVFQSASLMKPFVAVAAVTLAAEGGWSLEDRVESRMPTFRMADGCITHEFRVRDLLAHRSGFATFEGDLLWLYSDLNDTAILQRLGAMRPRYGFRSHFGYSNLMFMAAARALQSVAGAPWAEHLRRTLFDPLEMRRTVIGTAPLQRLTNVASPHSMVRGVYRPIELFPTDNVAAAGGLATSVNDLSRWLRLLVNEGRIDGRQIVPSEALRETWTPHSIIPVSPVDASDELARFLARLNPTLQSAYYGLGWVLLDHRGHRVIMHGGSLPGGTAALGLVPGRGGLVVLANTEDPSAVHAALYRGLDELLGLEPADWNADYLRLRAQGAPPPGGPPQGKPARASGRENLIGRYFSSEYGGAELRREADMLVLHLEHHPGMSCHLVAAEGERYWCTWSNPQMLSAEIVFARNGAGYSRFELTPDAFIDSHRYVFARVD